MRPDVLTCHFTLSSSSSALLCCWSLLTTLLILPIASTALLALFPQRFANRHLLRFRFIDRSMWFWLFTTEKLNWELLHTKKSSTLGLSPVFPIQQTVGGSSPEGLYERWFPAVKRGPLVPQNQTLVPAIPSKRSNFLQFEEIMWKKDISK